MRKCFAHMQNTDKIWRKKEDHSMTETSSNPRLGTLLRYGVVHWLRKKERLIGCRLRPFVWMNVWKGAAPALARFAKWLIVHLVIT